MKKQLALSNNKIKVILFFLLSIFSGQAQTIHYVKPVAEGAGDGSSWDNASSDLQEMINVAVAGDTIFVAKGVYKPNRRADAVGIITPNDKRNAFVPKSDVNIYGGFDPDNGISEITHTRIFPNIGNGTILSGDFNDDDIITGGGGTLSFSNNSENAYRVVIFSDVTNNTIFDGFAITGGSCIPGSAINGNGINIASGDAGGMMIANSSPIISNIAVFYNYAGYGGGIYVGGNTSAPKITNAVVFKNQSVSEGGGILNYSSSPTYTNITVVQNRAINGGGIYNLWTNNAVVITNSIIWDNNYLGVFNRGTAGTINHSIIQQSYSGTGNLNTNPLFKNMDANDYTLSDNSPAIDSGDNAVVSNTTDLVGNPRICGNAVDRGAYEYLSLTPNVGVLGNITGGCQITSLTPPTATLSCLGTIITGTSDVTLPITASATITWIYEDGRGNSSTQTQNVVIEDVIAPVANVVNLPDVTANCEVTNLIAPTATDNCTGTIDGIHNTTLPITSSTTIIWTYEDGNGNTSTQTQNVIINNDVTAPAVPTLETITEECSATVMAPTTTDNCAGTITGTTTDPLTYSTQGTYTINWTFDDGSGNTSTQTQNVVIEDVTAPVPDVATLADITAECEVTTLTAPTATDNCSTTVTVTNDATLPITASTTITWTYDDGNGNTSTQTQNVVIGDVTAPTPDAATLADITAECEVTALTEPTATDNCAAAVTVTNDVILPIMTSTTITWTYEDGNGNISTQTQNIVIEDVTAPTPDAATLADITAECEVTALTEPTATDNCATFVTVTNDATLPITASTTITWTYDDGNGNTSTQTQNVVISGIDNTVSVNGPELTANQTGVTYQWIDCNNGNAPIAGETAQTFTATANGNYAVEVTVNGCTETSNCIAVNSVGIEEVWGTELVKVYPNPNNGIFTVSTNQLQDNTLLEIYTQDGRLIYSTVHSGTEATVDLKDESRGVYILKVNNINYFRVIKN